MSFPYKALKISTKEYVEFTCINDINNELIALYDEAIRKGFKVGEALYTQLPFFTNEKLFITEQIQNRIKEYLFCKNFNTPIYLSLIHI